MIKAAWVGRIESPDDHLCWLARSDLGHIRGLASTARKADWASLVRFPLVEGSCVGRHVGHLQLRLRRGTKTRRTADEVPLCPGRLSGPDSLDHILPVRIASCCRWLIDFPVISLTRPRMFCTPTKINRTAAPRSHSRHAITDIREKSRRASDSNEPKIESTC